MKMRISRPNAIGLAVVLVAATCTLASDQPAPVQAPSPLASGAVALPATSKPALSPWTSEILKLVKAGLDQDLILPFVDSAGTFNLNADQVIALHQAGVPKDVVTAMLQHDAEIISGIRPVLAAGVPGSEPLMTFTNAPAKPGNRPAAAAAPVAAADELPAWQEGEPDAFVPDWVFYRADEEAPEQPVEVTPVRKPYPVKLTDPILVWRTEGRIPNTILLQSLP
jgi:hypothetical protein